MRLSKNESGFAHLVLIGLGVFFVGGAGTTVAANGSKPGDILYSIDRGTEKVRLAFALTDGLKESMHRDIAKERLLELRALFDEEGIDAKGISDALGNLEDHVSNVAKLVTDSTKEHAKEIDDELESHKSQIDKLFETKQAGLENKREQLKKEYEVALKNGDSAKAALLKAQIDGFESLLKDLEQERETSKQELETHEDAIEEHEDEAVQKQEEAEREAAKQQAEISNKILEEQSEAAKKAAEAQREAEKKAAEQENR
ncbi:MAG: DUF5667 domain-containing protein [Patescibacteria group bacterium]